MIGVPLALRGFELLDTATMGPTPAAASVVGGSVPVALAAIATYFIALVVSILVTYRITQGYLQTRQRPFLFMALGVFLLAPAPMLMRVILGNASGMSLSTVSILTSGTELLGLLCILYTVYEP